MTRAPLVVALCGALAATPSGCALVVGFTDVGVADGGRSGADGGTPDAPPADGARHDAGHDGGDATTPVARDGALDVRITSDSSHPDAASYDSGTHDVVTDAPVVCVALAPGATDVYVDGSFTGPRQTGSAGCPFVTISAATTWVGSVGSPTTARTIHVESGTYDESVTVVANVTLVGDEGEATTTISGSGACPMSRTCAVVVLAGGTLEGFTVTSVEGDGIETGAGAPSPVVKSVSASGSMANGIYALGALELGPGVTASGNHVDGLESAPPGTGIVHVKATSTMSNAFDNNTHEGVGISSAVQLIFEGGTASNNGTLGVRLSSTGSVTHSVTALVANGNGMDGVVAYGQRFVMRSSTMLGNQVGLLCELAGGNTVDIGFTATGGNVFATTADGGAKNQLAGLELCGATGSAPFSAEGDSWSTCPPTQSIATPTDAGGLHCPSFSGVTGYVDVINTSAAAGTLTTTGCVTTGL